MDDVNARRLAYDQRGKDVRNGIQGLEALVHRHLEDCGRRVDRAVHGTHTNAVPSSASRYPKWDCAPPDRGATQRFLYRRALLEAASHVHAVLELAEEVLDDFRPRA